jgi:hypothetical protein
MKTFRFFDPHLKQYVEDRNSEPVTENLKHTGLEYLFPNSEFSFPTLDDRVTPIELQENHPEGDRILLASGKRFPYTDAVTVEQIQELLPGVKDRVAYGSLFLKECSAKNEDLRVRVVSANSDPYEIELAARTWESYQATGNLVVDVNPADYLAMGYDAGDVPQLLLPKSALPELDSKVLHLLTPNDLAQKLNMNVRKIELAPHNFVRTMQILVVNDKTGENSTKYNAQTGKYEYGFDHLDRDVARSLTGDGHGKVSNELAAAKFGTDDRTAIQVRIIAKNLTPDTDGDVSDLSEFPTAKVAKGSVVAHDLASLTEDGKLQAVMPTSFFKGGDKVKPGLYEVSVWMGEIDRSREGGKQSISSLIGLYPAALEELIPKLEPKMANLAAIQNDPIAVARLYCDNFEKRQERLQEGQPEQDDDNPAATPVHQLPTEKYDVIRKALDTGNTAILQSGLCAPTLIEHLRSQFLDLAMGKDDDVKFDRGFAIPNKELGEGEICVPWMKDGAEVITYRAPLINTNGVHVLINKHVGDWDYSNSETRPNYILCNDSLVSSSNELQQSEQVDMGRDYDGDALGVLNAAKMPGLALAVKAGQTDRYIDNIKLPKSEFADDVSLEEAALQAETAPVGIIANTLTRVQSNISAIDMLRDPDGVATDGDRASYARQVRQQLYEFKKGADKNEEPLLLRSEGLDVVGSQWFDRLEATTDVRVAAILNAPRFDLIENWNRPDSDRQKYDLAKAIKASMYGYSKNNEEVWFKPPTAATADLTDRDRASFQDLSTRAVDISGQMRRINKVFLEKPKGDVVDVANASRILDLYQGLQKSGADFILEAERSLLREMVEVASFQNQIAVSMKKSATKADPDLVSRLNHFVPGDLEMMKEKDLRSTYTDRPFSISGITPQEILASRVNSYFEQNQIKVDRPIAFKSLFSDEHSPEISSRMLEQKQAFDLDWNLAVRLSSKVKNEEGCVLKISDDLGRSIELTNLCKFPHDLAYDPAKLDGLKFKIETNRGEEIRPHLDSSHKYVAIAQTLIVVEPPRCFENDIEISDVYDSHPPRHQSVLGTVCEFSRFELGLNDADEGKIRTFTSVDLAAPHPDLSSQYFQSARDTALAFRSKLIQEDADLTQYAAVLWDKLTDKQGKSTDDVSYQALENSISSSITYFFPDQLGLQLESNDLNIHRISLLKGIAAAELPIGETVSIRAVKEKVADIEGGTAYNQRRIKLSVDNGETFNPIANPWEHAVPMDFSGRTLTAKIVEMGGSQMLLEVPGIDDPIVFGKANEHYLKDKIWSNGAANISFEPIVSTQYSLMHDGRLLGVADIMGSRSIDNSDLGTPGKSTNIMVLGVNADKSFLAISIPASDDRPLMNFNLIKLTGDRKHGLEFEGKDSLDIPVSIQAKATYSLGVFLTDESGQKHQIGEFTNHNTPVKSIEALTPHSTSVRSISALVKAEYIGWPGLHLEDGRVTGKANRQSAPVILKDNIESATLLNSGQNLAIVIDKQVAPLRLPVVQKSFGEDYAGRVYAELAPKLNFDSTLGVLPLGAQDSAKALVADLTLNQDSSDRIAQLNDSKQPLKVVISGSRSIGILPKEAIEKVNAIMKLGAEILIGDAPGVDREVQKYLKSKDYDRVTVFHAYETARNNEGFSTQGNYASYADRDKDMCLLADNGLAIWDGQSKGTKANIDRLPTRVVMAVEISPQIIKDTDEPKIVKTSTDDLLARMKARVTEKSTPTTTKKIDRGGYS